MRIKNIPAITLERTMMLGTGIALVIGLHSCSPTPNNNNDLLLYRSNTTYELWIKPDSTSYMKRSFKEEGGAEYINLMNYLKSLQQTKPDDKMEGGLWDSD